MNSVLLCFQYSLRFLATETFKHISMRLLTMKVGRLFRNYGNISRLWRQSFKNIISEDAHLVNEGILFSNSVLELIRFCKSSLVIFGMHLSIYDQKWKEYKSFEYNCIYTSFISILFWPASHFRNTFGNKNNKNY